MPSPIKVSVQAAATRRQAKVLLRQIASLHEKAYRRGFQHGHLSGTGPEPPTVHEVADWRHCGYGRAVPAPGQPYHSSADSLGRLLGEIDSDELRAFDGVLIAACGGKP